AFRAFELLTCDGALRVHRPCGGNATDRSGPMDNSTTCAPRPPRHRAGICLIVATGVNPSTRLLEPNRPTLLDPSDHARLGVRTGRVLRTAGCAARRPPSPDRRWLTGLTDMRRRRSCC